MCDSIYCYTINLTPSKINNHALFNYSVCSPFCALCLLFGLQTKPMKHNYFQPVQFYVQILLQFAEKKKQDKTKQKYIYSLSFQGTSAFMKHRNFGIRKVHVVTIYCRLRFKAFQRLSRSSVQYHAIEPLMCDLFCICDHLP